MIYILALGVLTYEMATLKPSLSMIHRVVKFDEYPELPEGLYSEELQKLLDCVCDPDPAKRPTIYEVLNNEFVREFQHSYITKLSED